jgi:hypothetical protein
MERKRRKQQTFYSYYSRNKKMSKKYKDQSGIELCQAQCKLNPNLARGSLVATKPCNTSYQYALICIMTLKL